MKKQITESEAKASIEKSIDQFLTLIVEEKKRGGLMPFLDPDQYKANFQSQINSEVAQCVNEFTQRLHRGLSIIWQSLLRLNPKMAEQARVELQESIATLNPKEEDFQGEKLIEERIKKHETLKSFMGFSDKTLDEFYQIAHSIYEEKNFEAAAECFYFLCTIQPLVHRFWIGYAHSEQLLGRFNSALYAYAVASLIDPANPVAHYLSAECYKQLNDIPEAIHSLDLALACPKEERFAQLIRGASEFKNSLKTS